MALTPYCLNSQDGKGSFSLIYFFFCSYSLGVTSPWKLLQSAGPPVIPHKVVTAWLSLDTQSQSGTVSSGSQNCRLTPRPWPSRRAATPAPLQGPCWNEPHTVGHPGLESATA